MVPTLLGKNRLKVKLEIILEKAAKGNKHGMINTTPEEEEEAEPTLRPLKSTIKVAKHLTTK